MKPSAALVVGVTGLPCVGKSYVVELLTSEKIAGLPGTAIRADDVGHAVLARRDVAERLTERFGRDILDGTGAVVRSRVAEIVFNSPNELAWLESVLHPLIDAEIAGMLAAAGRTVVAIEAALLLAAGLDRLCDAVALVEAPRATRLARAARRGWDEKELTRREARLGEQFTRERLARSAAAIVTINNEDNDSGLIDRLRAVLRVAAKRKGIS